MNSETPKSEVWLDFYYRLQRISDRISRSQSISLQFARKPSRGFEFVPIVQLTSGQEVGWSRYLSQSNKSKPFRRMTAHKKSLKNTIQSVDTEEVVKPGTLRLARQAIENSRHKNSLIDPIVRALKRFI